MTWQALALALALVALAAAPVWGSEPRKSPESDTGGGGGGGTIRHMDDEDLLYRIERLEREVRALRATQGKPVEFAIYGVMNYYRFDWETDPDRKAAMDLERVVPSLAFFLADDVKVEFEVEFEHGGTGATMELDKFEEFGEYEQEVEKGGEVVVEELEIEYLRHDAIRLHAGHFVIPVGLINRHHRPGDYFTGYRSEAETSMIPVSWHESGLALSGFLGTFFYHAGVVNGLDSTGFSSGGWVREGHQTRFEEVNAQDLAVFARLEWSGLEALTLGGAAYYGNTTGNRPKPDLDENAYVTIVEVDGVYDAAPVIVRAQYMVGTLSNSEAVTDVNKGLSNNLNVKRTPVASRARAVFVEAGYDVAPLFGGEGDSRWIVFARYDDYDTMDKVEGEILDDGFWERKTHTAGVNWFPIPSLVVKAHHAIRELGRGGTETTTTLGMGFDY